MNPILLSIASFALGAVCFASVSQPDRAADSAAIRDLHGYVLSFGHRLPSNCAEGDEGDHS